MIFFLFPRLARPLYDLFNRKDRREHKEQFFYAVFVLFVVKRRFCCFNSLIEVVAS